MELVCKAMTAGIDLQAYSMPADARRKMGGGGMTRNAYSLGARKKTIRTKNTKGKQR
jgi:hypothetical protein